MQAAATGNRNLAAGNLMAVQSALRASLTMIDGALAMHALPGH